MNFGNVVALRGDEAWAEFSRAGRDTPSGASRSRARSSRASRQDAISPAEAEKTSDLMSAVRDLMAVQRAALSRTQG